MDMKVYEKTRYQNIYRHKKNKNYVIMISNPVKTSIARIEGKKIFKIEDALKIRDNPKIKVQVGLETTNKEDFDTIWCKYIFICKNELKLAYNTTKKKEKLYESCLKNKFNKKLSKITKEEMITFIHNLNTTDKQKNQTLKELKAFFNWCVKEEYLITSPVASIKKYKVEKSEMKFWIPEHLKRMLDTLNFDIENGKLKTALIARRTKLFILIEFSLGDRVGETRAFKFDSFSEILKIVRIRHSINYDRNSDNFFSDTKNYHSQRDVEISKKLIIEVKEYQNFLITYTKYNIKDSDLIFFNYQTNKPYSDATLRKNFYYYCDKAKVPRIRLYDLRHTYVATMMGEGKELYHISRRIGHKSYSTTVDKYGHLSAQIKREIAEVTDKYI